MQCIKIIIGYKYYLWSHLHCVFSWLWLSRSHTHKFLSANVFRPLINIVEQQPHMINSIVNLVCCQISQFWLDTKRQNLIDGLSLANTLRVFVIVLLVFPVGSWSTLLLRTKLISRSIFCFYCTARTHLCKLKVKKSFPCFVRCVIISKAQKFSNLYVSEFSKK